jgi:hypothetical protein
MHEKILLPLKLMNSDALLLAALQTKIYKYIIPSTAAVQDAR